MHVAVPELEADPEVDPEPAPLAPELLVVPLLDPLPELLLAPLLVPPPDAPELPELEVSLPELPLAVAPAPPLDDAPPFELAPELAAPAYEPPLDAPGSRGPVGPPEVPLHAAAADSVATDRSMPARPERALVDRSLMFRRHATHPLQAGHDAAGQLSINSGQSVVSCSVPTEKFPQWYGRFDRTSRLRCLRDRHRRGMIEPP